MGESFAPSVVIDGYSYTPEGWMWVVALALAGVEWAVECATDPAYDLRGKIDDYNRRKKEHYLKGDIEHLEKKLAAARRDLETTRSGKT